MADSPPQSKAVRSAYFVVTIILNIAILIFAGYTWFPQHTAFLVSMLWYVFLFVVIGFVSLGVFALIGLKQEVGEILDETVERSLTVIDFFDLAKKWFERVIVELHLLTLYLVTWSAYLVIVGLYVLLLRFYKQYGATHDVTSLTIGLSAGLVAVVALFNLFPTKEGKTWLEKARGRFKDGLSDGVEIAIFLFFLTMDRVDLFFLPDHLNILVNAQFFGYDLMTSSLHPEGIRFTLTLIIIAVMSEITRNVIKIVTVAIDHYDEAIKEVGEEEKKYKGPHIKAAIRKSFQDARDDTIKFITFTSFLMLVFLFFPRLKVLSMAVASLTSFLMDILLPSRLHTKRGNDLISRFLAKVFKV